MRRNGRELRDWGKHVRSARVLKWTLAKWTHFSVSITGLRSSSVRVHASVLRFDCLPIANQSGISVPGLEKFDPCQFHLEQQNWGRNFPKLLAIFE